ncbi:MAG: hypothetical protein ABFD90_00850 [Phycisphaerales bacterium]
MVQSESCEGCSQAHDCKKVYEHLGCTEGPPITRMVFVAFLLPLLVFIAALGGFGWLLRGAVAGPYRTPLALVLALAATTGLMLVVRIVARPHREK